MRFYQELDIIRALQKMPLDYLLNNTEKFKSSIDELDYPRGENVGLIR